MRLKLFGPGLLVVFLFVITASAQDYDKSVWHSVPEGKWTRLYLRNSLFPHDSRTAGYYYRDRVFKKETHYNDSSAIIFIPEGYKPTQAGYNNVIVHFHGWDNAVLNVMHSFKMLPQLYNSEKSAILIFAQGPKYAMDSGGGKLEDRYGLKKYLQEILIKLHKEKKVRTTWIGDIVLSAHSGGYRPALKCLVNGGLRKNIKAVFLFDAFYDLTENLIPWLKDNPENQLRSIFTEHLVPEHRNFLRILTINNLIYTTQPSSRANITIQYTRVCHECVVENTFEQWLKLTDLENIDR